MYSQNIIIPIRKEENLTPTWFVFPFLLTTQLFDDLRWKQYSLPNRAKAVSTVAVDDEAVPETDIEDHRNDAKGYETDISDKYRIHQPHRRRDHGESSNTQVLSTNSQVIDVPCLLNTNYYY